MSIEVLGLDQDGLLMDQRRQFLNEIETVLGLVESSPADNNKRRAVAQRLVDCLKDSAPWSAMIRASFSERILAL